MHQGLSRRLWESFQDWRKSSRAADEATEAVGCNSFTPHTKVLMADGSAKRIKDVDIGDKVLATDPETGETEVETVTAEIKGKGAKHLVKITVDVDGQKGSKTASVTATDGHPFWVRELGEWVDATDLKAGEWLRTGAGMKVQVASVARWTVGSTTVHNLTVSDLHTYFVLAGATSVLVHNINDPVGCSVNGEPIYDIPAGSSGGPGAGKRIPASMLGEYNIGVNADPSLPTPLCSYCRTNPAQAVDRVEPGRSVFNPRGSP